MGLRSAIVRGAPAWLRFYRLRLTLDWPTLLEFVPRQGTVLDVGCGAGYVDYALATRFPALRILGIDTNAELVRLAQQTHAAANVEYRACRLEDVPGAYDCVMLIDVLHHVPYEGHRELLDAAAARLVDGGRLLVKDTGRTRGAVSVFMDRYISGEEAVYMLDCQELAANLPPDLAVEECVARYRFPFPHYYIQAARRRVE